MGIESVSGVSANSYSSTVSTSMAKPVAEPQEISKVEDVKRDEESKQSIAEYAAILADPDATKQNATMKDVQEFNKLINHNTVAEFGYNEPTNRITIKIKDKETDEVIKEIPSEKALEMLARAWELAGLIVDEKR